MPYSPDLVDLALHFLCCFRRRSPPHFIEYPQPALKLLVAERTRSRLQALHGIFDDVASRFVQKSLKPFDLLNRLLVERERVFAFHISTPTILPWRAVRDRSGSRARARGSAATPATAAWGGSSFPPTSSCPASTVQRPCARPLSRARGRWARRSSRSGSSVRSGAAH